MPDDVTAVLIRSLVDAVDAPSPTRQKAVTDWEALAIVLEFGDGFRSSSGYAYLSDGSISPVACKWSRIEPAVEAYLASYYKPGDALPVQVLVQLERATGRYAVTFEDTDDERWMTRPSNFRTIREELRPKFD